jgi:DNA primase
MQDTAKYLIHADVETSGVVERNDVVGAIFGQTEGLLGEELEIRDLQDSSKVGRIDVEISSQEGRSAGELTIATSLDKVETAILAAALETIDRVGPCRSTITVRSIEDVRAAKRREVVTRAKRLLSESFDGSVMSSDELVEEVRSAVRVADVTEYHGYPAGPRVKDSDAIIIVEGRSDVLQLLKFGIKNAIAVEGTNVPEEVAALTRQKTVTTFLDGDRGGDLILKELAQVGAVDFVALAPPAGSVEDLERHEVLGALREKVPYDIAIEEASESVPATDGSVDSATETDESGPTTTENSAETAGGRSKTATESTNATPAVDHPEEDGPYADEGEGTETADKSEPSTESAANADEAEPVEAGPETLGGHVRTVEDSGTVRLLDAEFDELVAGNAESAFDLLREADSAPSIVILDGTLEQRLLDVCAQRGVEQVLARSTGEFVKRPASVRIRTFEGLLNPPDPDSAEA